MIYIVNSNDGTNEFDEVLQSALAQVLINMSGNTTQLIISELNILPEEIERNLETGDITILKDPNEFAHRSMVHTLSDEQIKAAKQLDFLAENALMLRDSTLIDMLGTMLKPGTNDLNFDIHPDGSENNS